MAKRFKSDLKHSDVTPQKHFLNRRNLIIGAGVLGAGAVAGTAFGTLGAKPAVAEGALDLTPNTLKEISSYNNYYEFGASKTDPAKYAHTLTTDPWSVKIDGLVEKPGTYDLADILKNADLEERIYRFRCVEAWSMVVPWLGFELASLLNRVGVQSKAKYVAFETLFRPDEMPAQKTSVLDWPYVEGLRLDEAMNPLTILASGLYGKELPKQNGAPLRLVVPWKYGFKSIKSIVRISLVEEMPPTTWNTVGPNEYGFYSNVNPEVDHRRWSQASERLIGGGIFAKRQPTLKFNGYEEQVADLYTGMDLAKNY